MTTPIYGLRYPLEGEPVRNTRALLQDNAEKIEAALKNGAIAPPEAQDLAAVSGRVSTLEGAPVAVITGTATSQAAAHATWTTVQLSTALEDTGAGLAAASNAWAAPRAGLYRVGGVIGWAANATGRRLARLSINGSQLLRSQGSLVPMPSNAYGAPLADTILRLAVNDLLRIDGYQDSGASLNINPSASFLNIAWLRA